MHKQSWTEELQEALMLGIFFLDRRNRDSEFGARTCPWLTPQRRDVIEFLQICALPSACAQPVQTGMYQMTCFESPTLNQRRAQTQTKVACWTNQCPTLDVGCWNNSDNDNADDDANDDSNYNN